MLRELSVQNLALIEDVRVDLEPGYCVWTGETGTGKSLLLTALGLVLGGKASADLVRAGCIEARASAVFEITDESLRTEVGEILGASIEDEELILTRRISAHGKSQAHANGMPVAIGTLRALGTRLIDIHGQHEGRALLDPERQRDWLDAYAGLAKPVASYHSAREAFDVLRRKRLALIETSERRERESALLAFERDELAMLDPCPGEHDGLAVEAHRLANLGELRDATTEAYDLLYEADQSTQTLLKRVAKRLGGLSDSVPEFTDVAANLERMAEESREYAYMLRRLGEGWENDPQRLEEIETRLANFRRLASRFRCKPGDLVTHRALIDAQLAAFGRDDHDLTALDGPLVEAWSALRASATALGKARRRAASSFAKAVQARLKMLSLGDARLTVEVVSDSLGDVPSAACPPARGLDRIEFLFAPNEGESPKPLRKIASGGELSRVTLAIKAVLAAVDGVPTLVFDEIDTGVGGRLGSMLGKTLNELATCCQVICITHLPQMASFATHHWVIRKTTERGRTRTSIAALSAVEREAELAAMLRGDSATESTRREAQDMLLEASRVS